MKRKVEKDTKENPSVFEKELTSLMLFVSVGPKYVVPKGLCQRRHGGIMTNNRANKNQVQSI